MSVAATNHSPAGGLIIGALLTNGADWRKTSAGKTALEVAKRGGHTEVARLLEDRAAQHRPTSLADRIRGAQPPQVRPLRIEIARLLSLHSLLRRALPWAPGLWAIS